MLEGAIQTGRPLKLEHELHLKFSCIRRDVTGVGNSREVQEFVLWQSETIYSERAKLSQTKSGQTQIPVHFKVPDDQPECFSRGNESIFWRLEAKSKLNGPGFHAIFDLPVFKVAGAPVADAVVTDSDPTAPLRASIDEIRRDEASSIRVSNGPGGREFYFPAARNPGVALSVTVAMFLFGGVAILTRHGRAPIIFPIVFGLVGVFLFMGTLNLWLKSTRVTINSASVRATTRWLLFGRTRQFPSDSVAHFATTMGMQSGSKTYTNIKLIPCGNDEKFAADKAKFQTTSATAGVPDLKTVMALRRQALGPSGITVASGIASAAEADWLVDEMNKALGHK